MLTTALTDRHGSALKGVMEHCNKAILSMAEAAQPDPPCVEEFMSRLLKYANDEDAPAPDMQLFGELFDEDNENTKDKWEPKRPGKLQ